MKKLIFLLTCAVLVLAVLCSCDQTKKNDPAESTVPTDSDNSPEEYRLPEKEGRLYAEGSPVFDHPSGIYSDSFTVSISTSAADCTVRYTTDGSIPKKVSKEFSSPLPVNYSKATEKEGGAVVRTFRASTFDKDGNQVGETVSATYVMAPAGRFTTKVVTLTTDPENLTGKSGLFRGTNYENRGRKWERPVDFKLIGFDGNCEAEQGLGMRINGTGTRPFPQKNLRLFARKEYTPDTGHLNYPLFRGLYSEYSGKEINEFDTFLLRGGASNLENSMITTQCVYELLKGTSVVPANFEPVAAFLNGEYYGLLSMIEDYGPYYFEEHFGTPEDLITTINFTVITEGGWRVDWELDDGPESEFKEWEKVRSFISKNDMTDEKNYKKACDALDIENFVDYIVMECYLDNWDWPRNNVRVWRYHGVSDKKGMHQDSIGGYDPDASYGFDGKWRFLAKDMDCSMSIFDSSRATDFFYVLEKDQHTPNELDKMYASLIKNPAFKRLFLNRLCAMMGGTLSPERCAEVISTLQLQIADEMRYQTAHYEKVTLVNWDNHITAMRTFAEERPTYVKGDVEARYGLKIETVSVGEYAHGTLTVNGNEIPSGGFFYAVRDIPQTYSFEPDPGYQLAKISVSALTVDEKTVTLKNNKTSPSMTPVVEEGKKPEPEVKELCINEIGHSDREKVNGSDWIELYNPTDRDISLRGMTLSNGTASFTFGYIDLPAGGYKVIFCDEKQKGGVYTGFGLSSEQTVTLFDAEGKKIDEVGIFTKSKSSHVGRYPDGGTVVSLTSDEITPGAPNVFKSSFTHTYDDRFRDAVMLNGMLVPEKVLWKTEDGKLATSIEKLSAEKSIPMGIPAMIQAAGYKKKDVIVLDDLMGKLPREKARIFRSEELGSYIIWTVKATE